MIAKLTAIRALREIRRVTDYLAGKLHAPWTIEDAGSPDCADQATETQRLDIEAAKSRRSPEELEHIEMFCLNRDLRYASQSRRDIYRRAHQEKVRQAYELWVAFARENSRYGCEKLSEQDPNKLLDLDLATFQNGDY